MNLFGFNITLQRKTLSVTPTQPITSRAIWQWPIIREPYVGAWQRNMEIRAESVLAYFAVFACATLIAQDIGKLGLRLVQKDENGIWTETESAAFSPVIRKPNHYQTTQKFVEGWVISLLLHGNSYVIKARDARGVVTGLFVLDPTRVTPLVTATGDVYYELKRDDITRATDRTDARTGIRRFGAESVVVPASEIIHDRMVCLYHPLIGVSPLYACGLAALQGLTIQDNSSNFFANGSLPGGILTVPEEITQAQANELMARWLDNYSGANAGKVALLTGGMTYQPTGMISANDAQLIEQLKWTAEVVCSCFHVPPYMIGVGPPPPYANVEPLLQQYYSQALQTLITSFENHLDEGLGLNKTVDGKQYGTEFNIDDLIWMDTATKTKAASDAISGSVLKINEARKKYYGYGPVDGGDVIYSQQQNFSIAALAERDRNDPFAKPEPAPAPSAPMDDDDEMMNDDEMKSFAFIHARGVLASKRWEPTL